MDPFEEFEFKPLTEGLGFHKKKNQSNATGFENQTKGSFSKSIIKNHGIQLLDDSDVNPLLPPLPRAKGASAHDLKEQGLEKNTAVEEILNTLQKNRRFNLEIEEQKRVTPKVNKKNEELKKSNFSFSAAFLDGMLILAASLLCMIIVLVITKVDLVANLTRPDAQGLIYLATFSMFATVAFIYLTLNRIYIGWTPGEWAFDQRVGTPEDLNKAMYSIKVVVRSLIVIATGFVVIPLLSVLFGRDLAGAISGARLYKKV